MRVPAGWFLLRVVHRGAVHVARTTRFAGAVTRCGMEIAPGVHRDVLAGVGVGDRVCRACTRHLPT